MEQKTFSFAAVFGIIVLLAFSYITFLGLVYWQKGEFTLPIILTVALLAIVLFCVFVMCKSKATRWKRIGTIGQTICGSIVLVTLLAAAVPFTNLLRVFDEQDEILKQVEATCESAVKLDEAYNTYVEKRIASYKSNLNIICNGKNNRPEEYTAAVANAAGENDEQKIANLAQSLKSTILPDSVSVIQSERREWLDKSKKINALNPMTAANIGKIEKGVTSWVQDYSKFSETIYKGETAEKFTYPDFENKLYSLIQSYSEFKIPNIIAIFISIICFAIMLLPYILTDKSLAGATSKSSKESDSLFE